MVSANQDPYDSITPFSILDVAKNNCGSLLNVLIRNLHIYDFDINSADDEGNSLLHIAALLGHHQLAIKCLELSANVNSVNAKGRTPLHLAATKGDLFMVQLLLRKGADPGLLDCKGEGAVFGAVRSGNVNALKCFREFASQVNVFGESLADVSLQARAPEEVTRLLTSSGCKTTAPVELACRTGNLRALDLLLRKQPPKSDLLHTAVVHNQPQVIETLLRHPVVDVNVRDATGCTPLQRAVECGFTEIALRLLERGADVNVCDDDGYTCLHVVGDRTVMAALLAKGADVGAVTANGDTCLHRAAALGDVGAIEMVRGRGLGVENRDGYKPVDVARQCGQVEVVRFIEGMTKRRKRLDSVGSKIPVTRSKSVGRLVVADEVVKRGEGTRIPVRRTKSTRRT